MRRQVQQSTWDPSSNSSRRVSGLLKFMPFKHKEDVEFFQTLELHLRQEHPPLCGRDHLAFRSSYFPCKAVIDGDLCEEYNVVPASVKTDIAEGLDRTPQEVAKKLEEFRTRYAF